MRRLSLRVPKNRIKGTWLIFIVMLLCIWNVIHNDTLTDYITILSTIVASAFLTVVSKKGVQCFCKFWTKNTIWMPIVFLIISTILVRPKKMMGLSQQLVFYYSSIYLGYVYLMSQESIGRKKSDPLFRLLGSFWVLCGIYGIIEYITGSNVFVRYYTGAFQGMGSSTRIAACYMHSIPYANALMMACAIYFYYFKRRTIPLFLCVVNIVLSGSRSGWISFAFLVILCFVSRTERRLTKRKLFTFGLGFIGLVVFLYTPFASELLDYIGNRMSSSVASLSTSVRQNAIGYLMLQFIGSGFFEIVFGHGHGSSAELFKKVSFINAGSVDNTFLMCLYDYGIIIAVLLVVFVIVWIRRFLACRTERNGKSFYCIVILSQILMSMFYDFLGWKNVSFPFYVILGMAIAAFEKRNTVSNMVSENEKQ